MTLIRAAAIILSLTLIPFSSFAAGLKYLPKCAALSYDPHFRKADDSMKEVSVLQNNLKTSFTEFEAACNAWKIKKNDPATVNNLVAKRDGFTSAEHAYRTKASTLKTDLDTIAPVATAYSKDAPECRNNVDLMNKSMVHLSAHYLKKGLEMVNTSCKPN